MNLKKVVSTAGLICAGVAACDSPNVPTALEEETPSSPMTSTPAFTQPRIATGPAVVSDSLEFLEKLERVDGQYQLIVTVKPASSPRLSPTLIDASDANSLLGLPQGSPDGLTRSSIAFVSTSSTDKRGVVNALDASGAEVYRVLQSPVLHVRVPDEAISGVIGLLYRHPNVDFFESDALRTGGPLAVRPDPHARVANAPPEGSNALGEQHTFHGVADTDPTIEDAWDYTRGAGIAVGVIDSGFAGYDDGTWHQDGQLLTPSKGIEKRTFTGCLFHPCSARDDVDHGTRMVGLVGANDNSIDAVGVAPEALVVSMKAAYATSSDDWVMKESDFQAAVDWAGPNGVRVLSMSFWMSNLGTSTIAELSYAYNTHDVLLVGSTGNTASEADQWPAKSAWVMAVGGLNDSGESVFEDANEEVSARSAGTTLDVDCVAQGGPCVPDGQHTYTGTSGGTSASAAIAAGIATLVRSANPALTAPEVRNRLINTATGAVRRLDAWRAVTGTPFISSESIVGKTCVESGSNETWSIDFVGGLPPFTYEWHEGSIGSSTVVGSDSTYTRWVDEDPFELFVYITDAVGDRGFDAIEVQIAQDPFENFTLFEEETCTEGGGN